MTFEIRRTERGYWTMFIDGIFFGNYDSYSEAAHELAHISETLDKAKDFFELD